MESARPSILQLSFHAWTHQPRGSRALFIWKTFPMYLVLAIFVGVRVFMSPFSLDFLDYVTLYLKITCQSRSQVFWCLLSLSSHRDRKLRPFLTFFPVSSRINHIHNFWMQTTWPCLPPCVQSFRRIDNLFCASCVCPFVDVVYESQRASSGSGHSQISNRSTLYAIISEQ